MNLNKSFAVVGDFGGVTIVLGDLEEHSEVVLMSKSIKVSCDVITDDSETENGRNIILGE